MGAKQSTGFTLEGLEFFEGYFNMLKKVCDVFQIFRSELVCILLYELFIGVTNV